MAPDWSEVLRHGEGRSGIGGPPRGPRGAPGLAWLGRTEPTDTPGADGCFEQHQAQGVGCWGPAPLWGPEQAGVRTTQPPVEAAPPLPLPRLQVDAQVSSARRPGSDVAGGVNAAQRPPRCSPGVWWLLAARRPSAAGTGASGREPAREEALRTLRQRR